MVQVSKRFGIPMFMVSILLLCSCGEQAVKPVDLANPADESNNPTDLSNELDYSEEADFYLDSSNVEFNDSINNDTSQYLNPASVDTTIGYDIPAGSSLKTINAIFNSVICNKSVCQLVFKTESDEDLVFCGAYGDFVSADFGTANRELVGKNFLIIYRNQVETVKDSIKKDSKAPCNSIVFAKQL